MSRHDLARVDRRRRGYRAAFVVFVCSILGALVVSGCGSSSTNSTTIGGSTGVSQPVPATGSALGQAGSGPIAYESTPYIISVAKGQLNKTVLQVPAGSGVLFVNAEDDTRTEHRFVADDGSFSTATLAPSGQYYITFVSVGKIAFHDALDPSIKGEIDVTTGDTSLGTRVYPPTGPFITVSKDRLSSATTQTKVGLTVTFFNGEDDTTVTHRLVADDGGFDTGVLKPGQAYSVTFQSAGSYPYHDALHPGLKGTIVVE